MIKLVTFFCFFTTVCFAQQAINDVLIKYKADKDLQHASYGFCVMDASSGKIISEYNSELALIPASTLKIVTTSAALGILGKDYVYKTNFYKFEITDSLTKKSTINLLVKASGDPSFGSRYFYKSDSIFLNEILTKLKSKLQKKVTGNVFIDNNIFDNQIPSTWIWGDIGNYFGAGATSLSYRDNKFSVYYNSANLNADATLVKIEPIALQKKLTITSQVKCFGADDNAYVYGDPNSYTRFISGTIPTNKTNYEVEAQLPKADLFFAEEITKKMEQENLIINGTKPSTINTYIKNQELVYTHQSPKLEKLVYYTNIKSDNHYAESLLNTLGAIKLNKQGTTDNGIEVVKKYWQDRGIDVSGLHMVDGSGLSGANTITTKVQATILSKIFRDSLMYKSFYESLPIAGKNGSMANLCKGTFAENNLRAKTGYINRARGYCGYVKTKTGKEIAFSILVNNYDCSPKQMKSKIESFLNALTDIQ